MKTLMIFAAGPLQILAITTARRLGVRVVALDGDANAPGLRLADAAHVVNITDFDACLAIARQERADGLLQICSEVSIPVIGAINETLDLPGTRSETARRATNKHLMRQAFAAGGAPSPKSFGVSTEEEAAAAGALIAGPKIVKPSRCSGSRGVTRIAEDARDGELVAAYHRALSFSADRGVVIEEFIAGPEFSVEMLIWNGRSHVLTVTDKVTTGSPYFVETGHSQPSRSSGADRKRIEDAAIAGVRALGLDWTAAHAEVKLGAGGPAIMEIGARLGGDFITTELVPRSTGIDMVAGAVRLALGEEPDLKPRHPPRGAAIRYLTPRPGRITAISGLEAARRSPEVRIVDVYVSAGETVPEITSSLSRSGHVIAEGATAEAAIRSAEAARDTVRIETVSSSGDAGAC
jgi:biotin carboxylase